MTQLNIKGADLITDVRTINEEILTDEVESKDSELLFFGNLDIPMQEIDAAIKKLQMMSAKRAVLSSSDI